MSKHLSNYLICGHIRLSLIFINREDENKICDTDFHLPFLFVNAL